MRADPGIFNGSLSLQFYIYALQGPPVPDIVLKIASDEVLPAPLCHTLAQRYEIRKLSWCFCCSGVSASDGGLVGARSSAMNNFCQIPSGC